MNIDSIKNYPTSGNKLKHKPKYGLESVEKSADLCDIKNMNRGYYYSGSFTGLNGAAAKSSKGFLKYLIDLCNDHTVIAQNLVALVLAAGFRPIAIMSLPGKKDKDDKIYASGHSIASGLIGFGFANVVMYPLGKSAKKFMKDAEKVIEKITPENVGKITKDELLKDAKFVNEKFLKIFGKFSKDGKLTGIDKSTLDKVSKALNMAPDVFIFGIVKAMLTVALIPPILKYVFGIEKKSKTPAAPAQAPVQNIPAPIKPDLSKFAGGVK